MSENLKDEILKLADSVFDDIKRVMDLNALETLRINVLGKKGKITNYLKVLKNLDYDSRIEIGTSLNRLKNSLLKKIEDKRFYLKEVELKKVLLKEKIDITLDSDDQPIGSIHPLSKTIDEIAAIFADMGF